MIVSKDKIKHRMIEIDITGTAGNAFVLIGYAKQWSKELGLDWTTIRKDLTSSDYEHLLTVMEKHFGKMVVFYR